jgi:PatG C-terminal
MTEAPIGSDVYESVLPQQENLSATPGPGGLSTPGVWSGSGMPPGAEVERPIPAPTVPPPAEAEKPGEAAEGGEPQASFVYAIGQVEARFPSLSLEREFAQVAGRTDTKGMTDRQVLQAVLSERENRYLARQVCWVFTIEGLPTYLLAPRDSGDIDLLIEALRPSPAESDIDVVIGIRGPLAPPEACDGLVVPIVMFDQLYSFDRATLVDAIPPPEKMSKGEEGQFQETARELFDRTMQMADNAGATDEHRAVNYLAVRYPAIYSNAAEAHRGEKSLTAVEVRPSRLSGPEKIVDVIFSYTHRATDVTDRYFIRVNVSGEFPFLVTKLQPFYER